MHINHLSKSFSFGRIRGQLTCPRSLRPWLRSSPPNNKLWGGEGHQPAADPLPSLAQYLTQKLNYENMAKDKSSP